MLVVHAILCTVTCLYTVKTLSNWIASQKEELTEPVEARERALMRLGAVWRPPLLLDVRLQSSAT
jgi:hypothetical protein